MKKLFLFFVFAISISIIHAQGVGINAKEISTGKQSVLQFFINDLNSRRLVTDALIEEYVLYGETYYLIWGDDECGYGSLDVRPLLIQPYPRANSYRQAAHFYLSDVMTEYDDTVEVMLASKGCFPYLKKVSFFKEAKRVRVLWSKPLQRPMPMR